LRFNQQIIDEIKGILKYLAENREHADWKRLYQLISAADQLTHTQLSGIVRGVLNRSTVAKPTVAVDSEYCRFSEATPLRTDIQVSFDSHHPVLTI